jgi:Cu(I)/Ag(I) efflux system membrane protein CusA/SilA
VKVVVPMTLLIIFLVLYLNFRRMTETLIGMFSVPFALVGGFWLMWALGYNLSVAVAVGFIAQAGVAVETGVVMLIYLDHAWEAAQAKCREQGKAVTMETLYAAVMEGAVERVRPKMMAVGGMLSSTVLTLAVIPAIYGLVKQWHHGLMIK